MDKVKRIEQLVQKTLDQLDRPEALPPNPYLYARILERLKSASRQGGVVPALLKPALLAALVVLNIIVAHRYLDGGGKQSQTTTRQELIDILAGDLNLDNRGNDLSLND